jgi:DNA mismatch endonuclease (patch repair protein)
LDTFSPEKRSKIMSLVGSTNTTPEMTVRSLLHGLGFRFRLHRKDLPGNPDIVLPKHSTVIFVHGCFWHRHKGCPQASMPASHQDYWIPKFKRTVERDKKNQKELQRLGWKVIVLWECELRELKQLSERLMNAITSSKFRYYQDLPIAKMAAEPKKTYKKSQSSSRTKSTG